MKKVLNQKGFTLLELMVVISILGVLSMLAVPKFSNSIASANTARVQADLQTINAAIVMYQAQNGKYPANISTDLNAYLTDSDKLAPPKGECFLKDGSKIQITATAYGLELNAAAEQHATCQEHVASDFGK